MLNPGITSYKDIERKTQELEREGVDIVALDIQEWAIVRSLIEDAHAKFSITSYKRNNHTKPAKKYISVPWSNVHSGRRITTAHPPLASGSP